MYDIIKVQKEIRKELIKVRIKKRGYSIEITNDEIKTEDQNGKMGYGFITKSGSFGSKTNASYIQLRKADRRINLDAIIASYLLDK